MKWNDNVIISEARLGLASPLLHLTSSLGSLKIWENSVGSLKIPQNAFMYPKTAAMIYKYARTFSGPVPPPQSSLDNTNEYQSIPGQYLREASNREEVVVPSGLLGRL